MKNLAITILSIIFILQGCDLFGSGSDEEDKSPQGSEQNQETVTNPEETTDGNMENGEQDGGDNGEEVAGSGGTEDNGTTDPAGDGSGNLVDGSGKLFDGSGQAAGYGQSPGQPESTACCSEHSTPGCDDAEVEKCVCAEVPDCCSKQWDIVCAGMVGLLECGVCKGDCCSANGTPGCDNADIESCVCNMDSNCCDKSWDLFCVEIVNMAECGVCNPETNQPETNSCCSPHNSPGCEDKTIQDCVCAEGTGDPACCQSNWDIFCVTFVEMLECGTCQ